MSRLGVRNALQSRFLLRTSDWRASGLSRRLHLPGGILFLPSHQTAVSRRQVRCHDSEVLTADWRCPQLFFSLSQYVSTAACFHTTARPTAQQWSPAKVVTCLSTPAGSEDPKAAAVARVMAAPTVLTSRSSFTASPVLQATSAPQVATKPHQISPRQWCSVAVTERTGLTWIQPMINFPFYHIDSDMSDFPTREFLLPDPRQ